ncbi:sphingomyelin phosphodiesterase 4 isoform X1 [Ixodes scapularis]
MLRSWTSGLFFSDPPGPVCQDRVVAALDRFPLEKRCAELVHLFQELSLKELQHYLPMLVESIFGFGAQLGWGLRTLVHRDHPNDFSAVRFFLGPQGPLLSVLYRLLSDGSLKYDFPVGCLPSATQKALSEGVIPPLYASKIYSTGIGNLQSSLQLNAFEFYMFHFAYHVVNPNHNQGNTGDIGGGSDAVYLSLLEAYLQFYLPTDRSSFPALPGYFPMSFTPQLSPLYPEPDPFGSPRTSTPFAPEQPPQLYQRRSLLKQGLGGPQGSPVSPARQSPLGSAPGSPGGEAWCSETFLVLLVEFWLGRQSPRPAPQTVTAVGSFHHSIAPAADSFLPNVDQMRMVRSLVKYLHFFTNCDPPQPATIYPCTIPGPLDDLRSKLIPQLLRKKLYIFLKQALTSWPLDASFRLPLETWLSFLQPWRYASVYSRDCEQEERLVEGRWQPFVQENLLFYTALFGVLLPRFFRMDLASRRNSFMLYRVTKVLSQENLASMIMEAEGSMGGSSVPSSPQLGASTLLRRAVSATTANVVRQQMGDLEEPGFVYQPMFGEDVRSKVNQLVRLLSQAWQALDIERQVHGPQESVSWWGRLGTFLGAWGPQDEALELRRTLSYLQSATNDLCHLFKLQLPSISSLGSTTLDSPLTRSEPGRDVADSRDLSFLQRSVQRVARQRPCNVGYQGNPDTQPIRSYEITFLVRILHALSCYLNDKYGPVMQALYQGDSFSGHLARQLLCPPTTYQRVTKTGGDRAPVRETIRLPPRVCLRPLAQKQGLGFLGFLLFFAYTWGYSPLLVAFLGLVWFALLTFARATVSWGLRGFSWSSVSSSLREHLHS